MAFRLGLRALGYVEGQNAVIEARYAEGGIDRLPALAAEIVRLNVDVMLRRRRQPYEPSNKQRKRSPSLWPSVVIRSAKASLPGWRDRVAILPGTRRRSPRCRRSGWGSSNRSTPKSFTWRFTPPDGVRAIGTGTEAAARSLGVHVSTSLVRNPSDVDHAFSSMPGAHVGGVIVDLALRQHQKQILALALKNRLPTISGPREFVEAGGLMAYGPHFPIFSAGRLHVDRILKGAKPADLPIEQPKKFEFAINLKTAKALGLTVPPSLLFQADR